jgi:4-amino-4-deoxy-L-arabinose transferase
VTRWARVWVGLATAAAAVALAGAPLPLPLDSDPLFEAIARQMLRSGDWLTPRDPDRPAWLVDKPPLTFWLMAVSMRVIGDRPAGRRAWHLLLAGLLGVATYRLARTALDREGALVATVLWATGAQVFYASLHPKQDVPLTLGFTLALDAWVRYRLGGRLRHAALTGLWLGLAMLTKGIVAPAAFGLLVVADRLTASGRTAPTGHWQAAPLGVLVAVLLVVAAPWYALGVQRHGAPFVETFFLGGPLGIGRYFHGVTRPLPYWQAVLAYVPMLLVGATPWTGLLPGAVGEGRCALRAGPLPLRLCALWGGLFFLLLSASPADRVGAYLLPVYPALAVLAARFVQRAVGAPHLLRPAAAAALVPLGVAVAGLAVVLHAYPDDAAYFLPRLLPAAGVLATVPVAFATMAALGRPRAAVAVGAAGVLLGYALAILALSLAGDGAPRSACLTLAEGRPYNEPRFGSP